MILSRGQRHMVLATVFFAFMGVLVKHLRHIPAHEVVCFRAAVSLVLCWGMLRRAGIRPWGVNRPLLLARGAAGTVALVLYFTTIQRLPLASAVTVQYLSPIFTILFAAVIVEERATAGQWVGFAVCFGGVALLRGFDPRISTAYLVMGIAAAALAGLAYNLVRRLKNTDHPLVIIFYFPLVTLPVVGPYTATHWVVPRGLDWLWLLGVGVFTQIAQVHLTRAYHLEQAANVSHFTYLGTLFALVLGWVFFSEAVPIAALAGIGLIVAGVVLATKAGSRPTQKAGARG